MAYNNIFYNFTNACPNFTFQHPPNFNTPPPFNYHGSQISDENFVKQFNPKIKEKAYAKPTLIISKMKQQLHEVFNALENLKQAEKHITQKIDTMSDFEWQETMGKIQQDKSLIEGIMMGMNATFLESFKKSLSKRKSKRLRLKKIKLERQQEQHTLMKERREQSLKIDENLQILQEAVNKSKQEEEEKIKTDSILREVSRKKHDAKKCISKLDALLKLRNARVNTAKGRGETVSEGDTAEFTKSIEQIKSLWLHKLSQYDKEEGELRAVLQQSEYATQNKSAELNVVENIKMWRVALFGALVNPQRDFNGNIQHFVSVRSQWDQYINSDGSTLPIGWVMPMDK